MPRAMRRTYQFRNVSQYEIVNLTLNFRCTDALFTFFCSDLALSRLLFSQVLKALCFLKLLVLFLKFGLFGDGYLWVSNSFG